MKWQGIEQALAQPALKTGRQVGVREQALRRVIETALELHDAEHRKGRSVLEGVSTW
jgi:hypothetical protein